MEKTNLITLWTRQDLRSLAYIEKEGDIIDEIGFFGTIKNKFPTIKEVLGMTKEERNELPIHYHNIIKKINMEENNVMNTEDIYKPDIKVFYFYGPSGIGKSKNALELIKKYGNKFDELKYENGFSINTKQKFQRQVLYIQRTSEENNNSNAPKGNDNSVDNGTKEEAATSNASVEKKAEQ